MKLCIALAAYPERTRQEILRGAAETGFDGCGLSRSLGETPEEWRAVTETRRQLGLYLDYVHCPFRQVDAMWREEEERAQAYLSVALDCLRETAEAGAPIMVQHVWIGMEMTFLPGRQGWTGSGSWFGRRKSWG